MRYLPLHLHINTLKSISIKAYSQKSRIPPMSGTFAVEKPMGVTSSQYLLQLQQLLEKVPDFRVKDSYDIKIRKRKRLPLVKAGHGGTLDPAADGVMIIAVNDATKTLSKYLECTKVG